MSAHGSAHMCYAPFSGMHKTFPQYEKYNIPIIKKDKISDDTLIVIPEILPELSKEFSQKTSLWWLSVDNFVKEKSEYISNFYLHMTQSEYARQYLATREIQSIMLTDYINDVFTQDPNQNKIKQICVNPSKGNHLIQEFKKQNPNYKILELSHMSRETIKNHLDESMIYIDFGHHPGKDRFPREAAMSNAIILTTNYGAARNEVDIPIDAWYKFDNLSQLSQKVEEVLNDYEGHKKSQDSYRQDIYSQKNIFELEVKNLLLKARSIYGER